MAAVEGEEKSIIKIGTKCPGVCFSKQNTGHFSYIRTKIGYKKKTEFWKYFHIIVVKNV